MVRFWWLEVRGQPIANVAAHRVVKVVMAAAKAALVARVVPAVKVLEAAPVAAVANQAKAQNLAAPVALVALAGQAPVTLAIPQRPQVYPVIRVIHPVNLAAQVIPAALVANQANLPIALAQHL